MRKTVAIGLQSFEEVREYDCFYIDKTYFIKEWWESRDKVTLITRPRRFGKTLNMSMLESFFSVKYAGRGELFAGLSVWQEEKFRQLQGTYPVIALSFSNVKENTLEGAKKRFRQILTELYGNYNFLMKEGHLEGQEAEYFSSVNMTMDDQDATISLYKLSKFLHDHYGKKVIIILDEYDTPMQEAWANGYWEEMAGFIRGLFHITLKSNPYLERSVMTGITRISRESIFSDLNHLKVVTSASEEYADVFGFTQTEVAAALEDYGLSNEKEKVKYWYDGFTFGSRRDIYNPWSILNFLDTGKYDIYWANTSSNRLVGNLVQEASDELKQSFERLLKGESITCILDDQIVYHRLTGSDEAIWSLLSATGYLKILERTSVDVLSDEESMCEVSLTNREVKKMFEGLVRDWFRDVRPSYNKFIRALLGKDVEAMNEYMNRISSSIFSCFDVGGEKGWTEPERFYHGFVLGLMVELSREYILTSNRESGFGRYDVMLEPQDPAKDAFILEFKVHRPGKEKDLKETVDTALQQIKERQYASALMSRGMAGDRIFSYGFAFRGKQVLIGGGDAEAKDAVHP